MNTKVLLAVSICVNLALGVAWFTKNPAPAPVPVVKVAPETAAKSDAAPAPAPAPAVKTITESLDWHSVESDDYKKYIANLRSIGCPKETIKDIIVADVNKLFEERKRAITVNTNKFEFWKTGNPFQNLMPDASKVEKLQELAKEKRTLLKELLGEDVELKPEEAFAAMNPFGAMFDFLPPGKATQVMELMQKMQSKMMKNVGNGGAPDADDIKQLKKTQQEYEKELAGILSPQEKEDYDLRLSQTAIMMRMQLGSFEPNEQEFRDIFKAKKSFDDEYSIFGGAGEDKEEQAKRAAAQKELDAKLQQTLGGRYDDYTRANDYAYQAIYKVAQKQGLPKESATKVYDMKKTAEQQAAKIRNDSSMDQAQKQAALQAIRTETERSIGGVLGDKGYKSYEGQAYWLKGISPDAKTQ